MKTFILQATNDQEKLLGAFLEVNHIPFYVEEDDEILPDHVLAGIARGQEDFKAGRFITHEEFIKQIGLAK